MTNTEKLTKEVQQGREEIVKLKEDFTKLLSTVEEQGGLITRLMTNEALKVLKELRLPAPTPSQLG